MSPFWTEPPADLTEVALLVGLGVCFGVSVLTVVLFLEAWTGIPWRVAVVLVYLLHLLIRLDEDGCGR